MPGCLALDSVPSGFAEQTVWLDPRVAHETSAAAKRISRRCETEVTNHRATTAHAALLDGDGKIVPSAYAQQAKAQVLNHYLDTEADPTAAQTGCLPRYTAQ